MVKWFTFWEIILIQDSLKMIVGDEKYRDRRWFGWRSSPRLLSSVSLIVRILRKVGPHSHDKHLDRSSALLQVPVGVSSIENWHQRTANDTSAEGIQRAQLKVQQRRILFGWCVVYLPFTDASFRWCCLPPGKLTHLTLKRNTHLQLLWKFLQHTNLDTPKS